MHVHRHWYPYKPFAQLMFLYGIEGYVNSDNFTNTFDNCQVAFAVVLVKLCKMVNLGINNVLQGKDIIPRILYPLKKLLSCVLRT